MGCDVLKSTKGRRLSGKAKKRPRRTLAATRNPCDDSLRRTTRRKAHGGKEIGGQKGKKTPDGAKKQFLSSMDPIVIPDIKVAAASLETTASQILETAAKEWLERHRAGKR